MPLVRNRTRDGTSSEQAVTAADAATLASFLRSDEMYRLRGNFRRLTARNQTPPARPLNSHSKTARPGLDLAEIAAVCPAVPQSHSNWLHACQFGGAALTPAPSLAPSPQPRGGRRGELTMKITAVPV